MYKKEVKKTENKNKKIVDGEIVNDILKQEVNLMHYPFFLIDNKKSKINKIEFKTFVNRMGTRTEIYWNVYSNSEYGIPSQFDKNVYMVIQEIIESMPKPIVNPVPIGTMYSLVKKMGISNTSNNYKNLKRSLERISATRIKSIGAFYSKEKKVWIEDLFGIFDRTIWKGELKEDGSLAEQNYVYLGTKFLENINANYVKPIDRSYYKELKFPIAKRLYELLGIKFYAIFQNKNATNYIKFSYNNLCDIIPMTNYIYISKIKQKLEPSLKELKITKFLADFKIENENEKVYVYFYPGPRALDEFKRFNSKLSNVEKYEISDDSDYDLSSPDHNHTSQGALLAQDNIPQNKEDKEAFEIVTHFYQKLTGNTGRIPSDRELIQARKLIDEFGKDVSMYIVDYALEEAPKTKFNIKTFGAVMQYAQEAASAYEKNIEDRKAKEESAKTAAIRKRLEAQIRQIKDKLSEAEYDLVEKEAFKRAMKKHPGLVLEDGTPHHDLGAFVYGEELDLVIVDWYINKKPDDITKPS